MATGGRVDPYMNFNYLVEIDGITRARFSEVSGLTINVEPVEYREGGNLHVVKLPGRASYGNITLRRGITDDHELYEWIQRVATGDIERKNGSVILMDRNFQEVARWNFFNAFPVSYQIPQLTASANEVAIETLELALERVEMA